MRTTDMDPSESNHAGAGRGYNFGRAQSMGFNTGQTSVPALSLHKGGMPETPLPNQAMAPMAGVNPMMAMQMQQMQQMQEMTRMMQGSLPPEQLAFMMQQQQMMTMMMMSQSMNQQNQLNQSGNGLNMSGLMTPMSTAGANPAGRNSGNPQSQKGLDEEVTTS